MVPSLLKSFKKGIPGGKLPPVPSTQNLQGVSTGLVLFSSIHALKLFNSLPILHATCKLRPIKACRTRPASERPYRRVCLSSRPSGGRSKVNSRVYGGWCIKGNIMCRVSAWDTTVSSLAFESEVSIRRFLELLVLIFDTGVVLLVYSRWYCKRDLNCRNVVQHKNMRIYSRCTRANSPSPPRSAYFN